MGKVDIFGSSIIGLGAKGVQLFYMMSAFTLMLSFKNTLVKKNSNLNFFIRRFFRIAPMFYLAIILWLFLSVDIIYALNDYRKISIGSITSHIFLLHGLNPNWQDSLVPGGWSVAVESIFYILCPFFFLKITSLKKSFLWFLGSLYIGGLITYLLSNLPMIPLAWKRDGWLYGYFPNQANVFLAGFILYYLQFESNLKKIIVLILGLLLIIPNFLIYRLLKFEAHNEINILASYFFILLFFLVKNKRFEFLKPNFIQVIGKFSYSIYIIHFIVLHFLSTYNLDVIFLNSTINFIYIFLITLFISTLISSITYKYVEHKFISFGKYIIKNLAEKQHV
jgi:peptidoglycan/LPS O-acetylase OafA/YrhL